MALVMLFFFNKLYQKIIGDILNHTHQSQHSALQATLIKRRVIS